MQYSKVITLITGLLFLVCLIVGFCASPTGIVDMSIFITSVTISGGIFGTSIVFYLRKAQVENTYKIKISLFKAASKERLHFNERMMQLKRDYCMSDADIAEIENDSFMDDFEREELYGAKDIVDESMREGTEKIQLERY